jgi:sortase A
MKPNHQMNFGLSLVSLSIIIVALVGISRFDQKKASSIVENTATSTTQESVDESYQISIDAISVISPIINNVDGADKNTYLNALDDGVAHLKGSAKPGEPGNVFIFGHSSKTSTYKGDYGEVFKNLNAVQPGDQIKIWSSNRSFVYIITGKKIVEPTDVSVANQDFSQKDLTLMTCWPIGSNKQRLIVTSILQ